MLPDRSSALRALESLRKRLLDLTARNRLINFRHTKRGSLRVIDELPNQLTETLLKDKEMRFFPISEPTEEELIEQGYLEFDEEAQQLVKLAKEPTAEEWAKHLGFDIAYDVPEPTPNDRSSKHADTAIQTLLYPFELEARLKALLQTSESAIQEMGANILYLSFGFLEWFESTSSDKVRAAPLFLIPVRLNKGRLNRETNTYEYTLSYSGEDIIPNLSLREKLKADFALALPDLDEQTLPEKYFEKVQQLISKDCPRWRVRRFISLALLNFSKLLMYLDLDPDRWPEDANIIDHSVVSHFLGGLNEEKNRENESPGDLGFGEEYPIDEIENIHDEFPLIDDADSSQHSALIDAVKGENLVIEGPPGTGKSQTITNLIAATMAQGKSVLFVAEKLAALEVVRRNLDRAGLGDFCLELHSHKSQKRRVLDEIEKRLNDHGSYRSPLDIETEIERFEDLKSTLKTHAHKVNQAWKDTGKSAHEILMAAARYRAEIGVNPESFHPDGYDGRVFNASTQRRNEDQVRGYSKVFEAVTSQIGEDADLKDHPWFGVSNGDLQIFDRERVDETLKKWQQTLHELSNLNIAFLESIGCEDTKTQNTLSNIKGSLEDLKSIPKLKGDELIAVLPNLRGKILENTHRYQKLTEDIQELYKSLSAKVGREALQDLSHTENLLTGSSKLIKLVGGDVSLSRLAEATDRLSAISDQLNELTEPFEGIRNAIDKSGPSDLVLDIAGLHEFQTLVNLISALNSTYWKLRDDLFDNEELDDLLPKLRAELEDLKILESNLKEVFFLLRLPTELEIIQLERTLLGGGIFKWLKSDWRAARKTCLGFAVGPLIKLKVMLPKLRELAEFSGKKQKFEENEKYKLALGEHLNGLSTDLTALEALREWYKQVRKEFGVGFGSRIKLGDAVLNLPPEIGRAARSLQERGINRQLEDILEDLTSLKAVFVHVEELGNENTLLVGDDGIIVRLLKKVEAAMKRCRLLANDDSISIQDLADRVRRYSRLKSGVEKWQKADFDNKYFKGKLGFKIGLDVDNESGFSKLRNTLSLADCLDKKLNNPFIQKFLYTQPKRESFELIFTQLSELSQAFEFQETESETFSQLVKLDYRDWMSRSGDSLDELIGRNQTALQSPELLQNWLDYVRVREQIEHIGLRSLVKSAESGEVEVSKIETAYKAGMFDILSREILMEEPELSRFSGHSQAAIQDEFKKYDLNLQKLQSEKIAYKIDQVNIPRGNTGARVSDLSGLALLEHECTKKKRHIPIRQLINRSGNALAALKPCFMMGPMSVSQYLIPGHIEFDLVVMDEASQIKPQDALGSIARGAQLIVVGDPKQLPPTSFFDRLADDEEDDPTAIEESESILDATRSMFPSRLLRWHYRSQHEKLIEFSNQSFYGGDLILFPSPHKENEQYGIKYFPVSRGTFVNRRNMEEAKIISKAVREHFQHRPEETLGVVAMSAEQRTLIEQEIESLAKDDIAFQECLAEDSTQDFPLFVKNLENVQGDERDVIFISMTYGPQEPRGTVFQRFGPINTDVGWRRLNVLFTRSKKRMHIFSSMRSDDIVADPSKKRGVHALRDFLSFCETGILHKTERETGRAPDSDFEISVMDALRVEGFDCVPQVGVAGFFIDVAVIDPGKPGRYLMGIECDGATYHSAKSARDRDRLRQTILERLGWQIRRIWSTDWFKNPEAVLVPIFRELNDLKSEYVEPLEEEIETETESIVHEVEEEEAQADLYAFDTTSLEERLIRFDREIIQREFPDTPKSKRLLRPAMLEALLEYIPTSKVEFLEFVPAYIRQATEASEGKYLEQVFDIINASLEEP